MDGRTEIRSKLIADSTITGIVGTYAGQPAIFASPVVPADYTGIAISIYQVSTSTEQDYGDYPNAVNCFSTSYNTVEDLQDAVYTVLNRSCEDETFFVCAKHAIIPPPQTGGDYIGAIEVKTRRRA